MRQEIVTESSVTESVQLLHQQNKFIKNLENITNWIFVSRKGGIKRENINAWANIVH